MELRDGFIFTVGLVIGTGSGVLLCKEYFRNYYKTISDEDIQSTHREFEEYKKKYKDSAKERANLSIEKPSLDNYAPSKKQPVIEQRESFDYSSISGKLSEEDEPMQVTEEEENAVQIITMYEFNEANNYEKLIINYYSDGIFSDEANKEIDISKYIGTAYSNTYIGNCKGDDICFRNNELMLDIAVVKESMTYEESLNETYK